MSAMATPEELNRNGMELYKAGNFDGAIAAYEAAVAQRPEYAPGHVNLALAYLKRGRPDDAVRAAQRAVTLSPQAGPAHCQLANAFAAKGRWNEAVAEYARAFELDRGQVGGLAHAGHLCLDHGLSAKAVEFWSRFMAAAPADHPRRAEVQEHLAQASAARPVSRF